MDLENVLLPEDKQERDSHNGIDLAASQAAASLEKSTRGLIREGLPRPASYTSVPRTLEKNDLSFSFSEDDLVPNKSTWPGGSRNMVFDHAAPDGEPVTSSSQIYSKPANLTPDSRITVQRTVFVSDHSSQQRQISPTRSEVQTKQIHPLQARRDEATAKQTSSEVSPSIASRNKSLSKSWSINRRSKSTQKSLGSPEKVSEEGLEGHGESIDTLYDTTNVKARPFEMDTPDNLASSKQEESSTRPVWKSRRALSQRLKRSQNKPTDSFITLASDETRRPVTPIHKSFSNSSVPSLVQFKSQHTNVPPLPGTVPSEKRSLLSERSNPQRDELWSVFRTLNADLTKYGIDDERTIQKLTQPT